MKKEDEDIEFYGDPRITSKDLPVPRWLIWTYLILPFVGLFVLVYYWNGTHGWLDRGYWGQLQKAANTTYPQKPVNPEDYKYP